MSVESAKSFINRVMSDKEFAASLAQNTTDEARIKFAKDAGYDFTQADVQAILPAGVTVDQLRGLGQNDELPDEVMEAIVGGKSEWEEFGIALGAEVVGAFVAAAI